jgi:hypothetical protein
MALVYENVEKVLDNVIHQANDLKSYATQQMSSVTNAVNNAYAAAQVSFPELALGGTEITTSGTLPPLPSAPDMPEIGDLPDEFIVPGFTPVVGGDPLDLSGAPAFTAQAPVLNYPVFPAWQNVPMPSAPDATLYAAPGKPVLAFADVPTLRPIVLPTLPTIIKRTFDAAAPEYNLATPETHFQWSEAAYQAAFVADISAKLLGMLNGDLGLSAEIETSLWERARERESVTAMAATQAALADFAARGFAIPPGALAQRLDAIRQTAQNNAVTVSREIAIESFKQRIENVKYAVAQCLALEQLLWQIHEARMTRAFEAEKLSVELPVTVFNALVSAFNARNQAFATQASVFRDLIQADMQELEQYKSAIEGQRLIGETNQQDVAIMTALDARVGEMTKLYLGEIQAFEALQRTEGLKFDNWGKEIQAATALINQQTQQYVALGEAAKVEIGKVNLFEAQARAYTAEASGFSQVKQLQIAQLGAQNDALRTQYAAYQAQLQQQTSLAQQALARVDAMTKRYSAFTQQYVAEASVAESASRQTIEQAKLELTAFTTEIELQVKQADYTLKRLEALAGLQMKAAEMTGQVGAQIAAQAVGAVRSSLNASGSATVSANVSSTEGV